MLGEVSFQCKKEIFYSEFNNFLEKLLFVGCARVLIVGFFQDGIGQGAT